MCQWKFFVFRYRVKTSARSSRSVDEIAATAGLPRSDVSSAGAFMSASLVLRVLEKREEVGVDLVLAGRAETVGRAGIDLQGGRLDERGREQGGGPDRHDLVVVAVDDERRNVDPLQILRDVRLGE